MSRAESIVNARKTNQTWVDTLFRTRESISQRLTGQPHSLKVERWYFNKMGICVAAVLGLGESTKSSSWLLPGAGSLLSASTARRPFALLTESSFALRMAKPELKARKAIT